MLLYLQRKETNFILSNKMLSLFDGKHNNEDDAFLFLFLYKSVNDLLTGLTFTFHGGTFQEQIY